MFINRQVNRVWHTINILINSGFNLIENKIAVVRISIISRILKISR